MIALALALTLAAAAGPNDTDLPRSLSIDETPYLVAPPAAAKADLEFLVGVHLGVTGAWDAEDPTFMLGANFRLHILPWLGAEVTLDFSTRQSYERNQIHVTEVPIEVAGLFYPPLELPVKPYGIFGFGFDIADTSYTGAFAGFKDSTDLQLLFFLGFGVEFELTPNIVLDANLRFVFVEDPPHFGGNSADWVQFTLGAMIKLSK
ncbi:MAG: porin family protein [Planctomycetes bacterium]|nr:porin family protein [Planctomycetota bacterium]